MPESGLPDVPVPSREALRLRARDAARDLLSLLQERAETLATCESLTGGLVAATLTSIPGASAVFRGSLVTYATDLKATLAGVDPDVLDNDGAVAAATAEQMARGCRRVCGADWGIAVTGVAGPDSQEGKPVGLVFVGVSSPRGTTSTVLHLVGDRDRIVTATVESCLRAALDAAAVR